MAAASIEDEVIHMARKPGAEFQSYRLRLPDPWKGRGTIMTGGLVGIGFGHGSDLLLVVTHDGRGVVDCLAGEKVARDTKPVYPDELTLRIQGIGPLAGSEITVAGIFGGSLPIETDDGWVLEGDLSNSRADILRLLAPEDSARSVEPVTFTGFIPELRAFGFSPTGRSFVIATGADISIFVR